MDNHYNHFKKIDAHSHIGKFGSPFNIDFDLNRLTDQMEEYNIEKTILCPAGCHLNEELKEAYQAAPDKIIPLCWVNANEGQEAYDMLEQMSADERKRLEYEAREKAIRDYNTQMYSVRKQGITDIILLR